MDFYFFRSVPENLQPAFKDYYGSQNLKALRVSAALVGSISLGLLVLNLLTGFNNLDPKNDFYAQVNTALAMASSARAASPSAATFLWPGEP